MNGLFSEHRQYPQPKTGMQAGKGSFVRPEFPVVMQIAHGSGIASAICPARDRSGELQISNARPANRRSQSRFAPSEFDRNSFGRAQAGESEKVKQVR